MAVCGFPIHSSYDPILKSNTFELLFLTYGQGKPRTLNAVDLKSGELRWSKEASSFSVLTETRVLVQTVERREKFKTIQRAAILNAKTGDLIKTLPADYEVVSAFEGSADDQSILFNKKTGEIARVNLETGFVSDVQSAHVFSPGQVVSLGLTLLLSTQESKRRLLA